MNPVHPRFLVDEHQQPTDVVLSLAEWRLVLDALEELDDIRAYDEAKVEPQEFVSLEEVKRQSTTGEDR
jgi:hypothetical protein